MAFVQIVWASRKMRLVMKINSKRPLQLCLTAFFIALSIFAVIIFEANHKGHEEFCHEENCPICLVLQIINNIKDFFEDGQITSAEILSFSSIKIIIFSALILAPATLVKQKVKLII